MFNVEPAQEDLVHDLSAVLERAHPQDREAMLSSLLESCSTLPRAAHHRRVGQRIGGDRQSSLAAGANAFLPKPIEGAKGERYRQKIGDLIKDGKMRDAMATEVKDVRRAAQKVSGDRTKYNEAMREMLDYAKHLDK